MDVSRRGNMWQRLVLVGCSGLAAAAAMLPCPPQMIRRSRQQRGRPHLHVPAEHMDSRGPGPGLGLLHRRTAASRVGSGQHHMREVAQGGVWCGERSQTPHPEEVGYRRACCIVLSECELARLPVGTTQAARPPARTRAANSVAVRHRGRPTHAAQVRPARGSSAV